MSTRPDEDFIEDILNAADRIQRRLAGRTQQEFLDDDVLCDAVMLQIAVIGNAARGLSPELRGEFPDVEWPEIWGMRNLIVHAYHIVSARVVWETARVDVPRLARLLRTRFDAEAT